MESNLEKERVWRTRDQKAGERLPKAVTGGQHYTLTRTFSPLDPDPSTYVHGLLYMGRSLPTAPGASESGVNSATLL